MESVLWRLDNSCFVEMSVRICQLESFIFRFCSFLADMPHLSELVCVRIVTLKNEGYRQKYSTWIADIHQSTVSRIVKRYNETGEYKRRPGQGRKRYTAPRDDQYLRLKSLRNRTLTAPHLKNELLITR